MLSLVEAYQKQVLAYANTGASQQQVLAYASALCGVHQHDLDGLLPCGDREVAATFTDLFR